MRRYQLNEKLPVNNSETIVEVINRLKNLSAELAPNIPRDSNNRIKTMKGVSAFYKFEFKSIGEVYAFEKIVLRRN